MFATFTGHCSARFVFKPMIFIDYDKMIKISPDQQEPCPAGLCAKMAASPSTGLSTGSVDKLFSP
jgi:hypothetical protein